jgi:hypothetical protein
MPESNSESKSDAILESAPDATNEKAKASQTRIHILIACGVALAMAAGLVLLPAWGKNLRQRELVMIQRSAVVDLKLIYDQEHLYKSLHGYYTTDLNSLGIAPKRVLYKFGFLEKSSDVHDGVDPSILDLDQLKARFPRLELEYSAMTQLEQIRLRSLASLCSDCTATVDHFRAIAAANLDNDPELDVWTIDQDGQITHLVNDIAKSHTPQVSHLAR